MTEMGDNVSLRRIEADAEITPSLVKKSARRYVWSHMGVGYLIAMGFVLLGFLFELVFRSHEWLIGAFGVILIFGLIFPINMWRTLESNGLSRLGQMKKPWVHFIFDEKGFVSESELGSSSITWKTVTGVWEFPELWFLFMGKQHVILPAAVLSNELRQFIKTKIAENRNKTGASEEIE